MQIVKFRLHKVETQSQFIIVFCFGYNISAQQQYYANKSMSDPGV